MPGTDGQTRWLSADEQQAWRATVHLSQLLMRQLDRDLNAHGLNGHDYEILVELSEAPDQRLRMTELADATSQSCECTTSKRCASPSSRPSRAIAVFIDSTQRTNALTSWGKRSPPAHLTR